MNLRLTVSNILILISAAITFLAFMMPSLYIFGMNNTFLNQGLYHIYIIQFFTGSFLHGSVMHLVANSFFIFVFGNVVEGIIGKRKFIYFFLFSTIFDGVLLSVFTNINTVGISGFCMALIAYYTLELKSRNDMEYKGGITALIINIGIGFMPGISLLGHLFGAVAGILYYLFNKEFFRRKYVGADIEA